jgi:hypothetical protein
MNLFISRLVEIYSAYRLSLSVYKLTISIWGGVTCDRLTFHMAMKPMKMTKIAEGKTLDSPACILFSFEIANWQVSNTCN